MMLRSDSVEGGASCSNERYLFLNLSKSLTIDRTIRNKLVDNTPSTTVYHHFSIF